MWIVDVYAFMVAGLLITMGAVGDRIGRRRLLLIGAAAFAPASVAAALAPTATALIAARAALGIAGATLAPSTLALIRTMFSDPRQRSVATSVWVLSFLAGGAVGPILGGVFLQTWWWGGVFLLGVPVMLVLLAVGPVLLPEYRNPAAGRIDLISAGLSLASILGVVYLLKEVAGHGLSLPPVAVGGAGVLLGVVFVRRRRRLTDPLVDLRLLREPGFAVALTVLTIGSVVLAGSGFLTAQYLQLVLGLSPLAAGLWTLPPLAAGVAAIAASQSIGRQLAPRLRTGRVGCGRCGPVAADPHFDQRGRGGRDKSRLAVRGLDASLGRRCRRCHWGRAARPGRSGSGVVGNHAGTRRRARHRRTGQYRHRRLPASAPAPPGRSAGIDGCSGRHVGRPCDSAPTGRASSGRRVSTIEELP